MARRTLNLGEEVKILRGRYRDVIATTVQVNTREVFVKVSEYGRHIRLDRDDVISLAVLAHDEESAEDDRNAAAYQAATTLCECGAEVDPHAPGSVGDCESDAYDLALGDLSTYR